MKTFLTALVLFADAVFVRADWVAGRDMGANELPNGNGLEQIDPNPTVPEWSYGYRGTLNSIALTLFTPAQHTNAFNGNSNVQGFTLGDGNDSVVNLGSTDAIFNFGFGPLNPLHPGDMDLHPGPGGGDVFEVVRWTAPASGTYILSASWSDLDPHSASGTNGAEGAITVNGTSIFDVIFPNGGGTSTSLSRTLAAGDIVDFALGSAGDYRFDSTEFNATITAIPEPATWVSVLLAVAGVLWAARRKHSLTKWSGRLP